MAKIGSTILNLHVSTEAFAKACEQALLALRKMRIGRESRRNNWYYRYDLHSDLNKEAMRAAGIGRIH